MTRVLREKLGQKAHLISVDLAQDVKRLKDIADETWCFSEKDLVEYLGREHIRFDLVFFSHSLEHFQEPAYVLKAFANHLAKGGVIIIEYPNGCNNLWLRDSDLSVPDLFFFTPQGMEQLANRTGCRILAKRGASPGPDVLASRENTFCQSLGALLFIVKNRLVGNGSFPAETPMWCQVVLTKEEGMG